MSARRFKFVSPGVFINEIDNSQLPRERAAVGPVVVGRLNQGPGLRPVTVSSFSEFVEIFGNPVAGGIGDDIWRNGNTLAPTYAAYAAQAYLRNAGPLTVVRALGVKDPSATTGGESGWKLDNSHANTPTPGIKRVDTDTVAGGAYGLFVFTSGSDQKYTQSPVAGDPPIEPGDTKTRAGITAAGGSTRRTRMTGSLAAVWYFDQGGIVLSGSFLPGIKLHMSGNSGGADDVRGKGAINSMAIRPTNHSKYEFTTLLYDKVNTKPKKITFNFDRNSDRYIRKVFNTNPTLLGDTHTTTLKKHSGYFLGESFDRSLKDLHSTGELNNASGTGHESMFGVIMALDGGTTNWGTNQNDNQPSRTGWFIGQDLTTDQANFEASKQQKLFRFESLNDGAWSSKNLKVSIHDHRGPTETNPYGSFSVLLRRVDDSDAAPVVVERFSNCNLNPNSTNYIARKIGDQYQEWDTVENRYRVYNQYANQSSFVRVVMDEDVDTGVTDPAYLPWGFWGPPKWKSLRLGHQSHGTPARKATATLVCSGKSADGNALVFTNALGKTVTVTIAAATNNAAATGNTIGTADLADTGAALRDALITVINRAVDQDGNASQLKAAAGGGDHPARTLIVTQNIGGTAGNASIVNSMTDVAINGAAEDADGQFIGGSFMQNTTVVRHGGIAFGNVLSGSQVARHPDKLRSHVSVLLTSVSASNPNTGHLGPLALSIGQGAAESGRTAIGDVPLKANSFFACFASGSSNHIGGIPIATGSANIPTTVLTFPSLPLRVSSSAEGLQNQKKAFFGVSTYRSPSSTRFEPSYLDLVSGYQGQSHKIYDPGSSQEAQFIFTLDDLVVPDSVTGRGTGPASNTVAEMVYVSGSRRMNQSYTALSSDQWSDLVKTGFTGFTSPLYGGTDGLDIKEREPFGDHVLSGKTYKTSSPAHSLKRAIDSVQDPEVIEMNVLTVPGVREPLITNHALAVCEERADAIAIIDPEKGGYIPTTETKDNFKTRISNASVADAVQLMKDRGINSSYGCAYYPWVKMYDEINDKQVWVPPSVVALGTFASTQARSELWFAPAGFTRGGLTEGSAGVPVLGVSQRLSSKDRDDLYETNINPIAQFPAEGIVIFGQKTLQVTPSALDRINVRRLMVFLKKEISIIASRLVFDQNVNATWNRFRGQVEPFLEGVKSRLGLTDYRVILDETTTTPELIDRNIMYAKIFLKPARSIEFIAIDFVITNSGASFDD